jgi:hypothetical protein
MAGSRAWTVAMIAGGIVLIAYVIDLVAGSNLSKGVADATRVAVVVAAVVCVGVIYQAWSVGRQHTVRDHAAVAAALLGGALAASSAFSAGSAQIFGNSLTATAGVAGLAVALAGSRPDRTGTEGRRP